MSWATCFNYFLMWRYWSTEKILFKELIVWKWKKNILKLAANYFLSSEHPSFVVKWIFSIQALQAQISWAHHTKTQKARGVWLWCSALRVKLLGAEIPPSRFWTALRFITKVASALLCGRVNGTLTALIASLRWDGGAGCTKGHLISFGLSGREQRTCSVCFPGPCLPCTGGLWCHWQFFVKSRVVLWHHWWLLWHHRCFVTSWVVFWWLRRFYVTSQVWFVMSRVVCEVIL